MDSDPRGIYLQGWRVRIGVCARVQVLFSVVFAGESFDTVNIVSSLFSITQSVDTYRPSNFPC